MTKEKNNNMEEVWRLVEGRYLGRDKTSLEESFARHMEFTQAKTRYTATDLDAYKCLAYAINDRMMELWNDTQTSYYEADSKRVYYLSLEYLMGRTLGNSIINLGMKKDSEEAMKNLGHDLSDLENFELDAGLGNGGLGRLAACFLDSMASLQLPGMGYGIGYDYGIFEQKIVDGQQIELPDHWLKRGNTWLMQRPEYTYQVKYYGKVQSSRDATGKLQFVWANSQNVHAVAYDLPIPGYKNNTVNNLRLWKAEARDMFDLAVFNKGDYISAVEKKILIENISKVLYPRDDSYAGKELRLKQEYFFVSASLQDIIRRFKSTHTDLLDFPKKVAIQLNDTHPVIAIPELMRILMDEENVEWNVACNICKDTFSFTNHTILPEALETWPIKLVGDLLPRHLDIIYEINHRFLNRVKEKYPKDVGRLVRMSIIEERGGKSVKMANLALIGSHKVNGVAKIHTEIIKHELFKDFYEFNPEQFTNKTNGITQRRWLLHANPRLANLITETIGEEWVTNLDCLKGLLSKKSDQSFQKKWKQVKDENKKDFAEFVKKETGITIDPSSLFDCQIKRIHEYKRQLLNILHVIHLYNKIKEGRAGDMIPRTVFFAGKAAPGYQIAKDIIALICAVAKTINDDQDTKHLLKVVFLENYGVSLAEKIVSASELSEQLSTAGMEASGTGNMKLTLNGSLTIGTLDGANVEIKDEVGNENIFIFGLTADEVSGLRRTGYNPSGYYHSDEDLKKAIELIKKGVFDHNKHGRFNEIVKNLLERGDYFLVTADFTAYKNAQMEVERCYKNTEEWTRKSIINTACSGKFSSDRVIKEYAEEIWKIKPQKPKSKKNR